MIIKIVETKEEKEQALQIRKTVFVEEQKVSLEEEIDGFEDQAIHFIGYEASVPVAASRLRWVDQFGKLERICILKDFRGKSFGKQMLKDMEAEIIKNGYKKAKLNAQTRAIEFYKQAGYEVISDEFLDAGIPHVTMTKKLD